MLEDFEEDLEMWYHDDQGKELDFYLCVDVLKQKMNYSCCVEEYIETSEACMMRQNR